jgi:hypothetical protein
MPLELEETHCFLNTQNIFILNKKDGEGRGVTFRFGLRFSLFSRHILNIK